MGSKIIHNSKLIMYNIDNRVKEKQLMELCRQLGYNTRKIKPSDADSSVGSIAGIKISKMISQKEKAPLGYKFPEIIIFSGLSDGDLDRFLTEYKKAEIEPVPLKAIVTPHNISWSLYELVKELQRERISMMLGRK